MIKDYFLIAFKEIRRRKLRSYLTLFGIIIGIATIVSLILLGSGLKTAIENQASTLGQDKLFISPKGNSFSPGLSIDAITITDKDLEVVRKTSGVKMATGFISTTAEIEINNHVRYFLIYGESTDPLERELFGESNNYKIDIGRFLEKGDHDKAVLGYSYQESELFGKSVDLDDSILLAGREFKVVGITQKTGSPPDDQAISIPLETYKNLFQTGGKLGMLIAQTESGEDPLLVAKQITKELRKSRDIDEGKEDFSIQTPQQLLSTFSTILDIVQAVLVGIAAISLLVGGIGIMNTMYTSVLERTKEIGILKALGARNSNILTLFLIESGFYGIIGGIVGIIFGVSFALSVEYAFYIFVGPAYLAISINFLFLGAVLFFSFIIGALSGIAPARRASKMNPVDSLRYE